MKIVYLCSARLPSERAHGLQIVRMCDALAGLGHEVVLLHPAKRQVNDSFDSIPVQQYYDCKNEFTVESISIFQLPDVLWRLPSVIHRPLMNSMNLMFEKRLANRALSMNADLYFSRDMTPHAARKINESGERCVLEFHQTASGSLATRALRVFASKFGDSDAYSFAVTGLLAQDIEQEFQLPSGVVGVHHDGVDLELFTNPVPQRSESKPVVTYAGSLQPNRGVDVLIEAASLCDEVTFEIVGGTPSEVDELRSFSADRGVKNVSFIGQVPPKEVPAYLQRSNLLVVPMRGNELHTTRHASPLKLFEYMASGTPIVATDMDSVREVVRHRENAYLVASDDATSLAEGIKAVLADPELAVQMSANALREVEQYSWSRRAQQIIERAGGAFK